MTDPPRRIVSLAPSVTELLLDLGMGPYVVGITRQCRHPEVRTRAIQKVGDVSRPDVEAIHGLLPDLVFADRDENPQDSIGFLRGEFLVWDAASGSLQQAVLQIRTLGEIIQKEASANWLADKIESRFAAMATADGPPGKSPATVYLKACRPWQLAGAHTLAGEQLARIGLANIASENTGLTVLGEKELSGLRPDLVLLSSTIKEHESEPLQRHFPHVPVIRVEDELLSCYGSRLLRTPAYLQELREKLP